MKKQLLITGLAIIALHIATIADTTITNNTLGFSAYLPDHWVATQESDSHVVFNDTTLTYKSQVVIKKHVRNPTDYLLPTDWTRAHFIAYLLVVQYSWDPFGAVLYFDSTANCKQDSLWAPEAFSEFYTIDTVLGSWNEYMRYTATDDYGYELYALGDTVDMKLNIGMYMAIINFIQLDNGNSAVKFADRTTFRNAFTKTRAVVPTGFYTMQGKRCLSAKNRPNGIYYHPASTSLQVRVK